METGEHRRRNHLLWLGPLVTITGALSYFLVFARFPVLRDFPWINLPLVAVGFGVSGLGVWRGFARPQVWRGRWLGSAGFLFSILLAGLFCAYIFFLSYLLPSPTPTTLELVHAPDFTLSDHTGVPVRLEDYRGRKVILTFYRGYW